EIRSSYRNQIYTIEFKTPEAASSSLTESSLFDVIDAGQSAEHHKVTIRLKDDNSLNDILLYLIPQVEIQQIKEVIPSMHDIFIANVTESSTNMFSHYEYDTINQQSGVHYPCEKEVFFTDNIFSPHTVYRHVRSNLFSYETDIRD